MMIFGTVCTESIATTSAQWTEFYAVTLAFQRLMMPPFIFILQQVYASSHAHC